MRDNDILIATVRPNLLNHLHFKANPKDFICSTGFAIIRCNAEKADAGFIYQHFFYDVINQQIEAVIGGSNYPAISSRDVKNLVLRLPKFDEQCAIAAILGEMDAELEALAAQVAKTQALKQGMMQDLLTGAVRLAPSTTLPPSTAA